VVWRYEEAGWRRCLWEIGCKERLVTLGKTNDDGKDQILEGGDI